MQSASYKNEKLRLSEIKMQLPKVMEVVIEEALSSHMQICF